MMDIDDMEAGREMDKLIAEKIMDWKWCLQFTFSMTEYWLWPPVRWRTFKPAFIFSREELKPESNGDYTRHVPLGLPNYSTEITAAFQVVEKMNDRMWAFHWLPDHKLWQASFIDQTPMVTVEAPALPHAICKLAPRAVK